MRIVPGTQAQRIYGKSDATEIFACNYGLNEAFAGLVFGVRFTGKDELNRSLLILNQFKQPFFIR